MHLNIILRVYELRKSNINLLKYNINFNRVHLSGKDEETYVTVCFKRFRCSSVGFNENLNYIYQQMSEVIYILYSFLATKASASSSWLDVPGAAVPTCIQSFCHCRFCRGRTGFIYTKVILLRFIIYFHNYCNGWYKFSM